MAFTAGVYPMLCEEPDHVQPAYRRGFVQSWRSRQAGGGQALSLQSVLRSSNYYAAQSLALAGGSAGFTPPGTGGPGDLSKDGRQLANPAQYRSPSRRFDPGA